jgi:hypothetical protein
MRPIYSSHLLSFNLGVIFGFDPHDQMSLITSPPDLDKANVAISTYVGTLTAIHLFAYAVSLITVALFFVWRHIVLELGLFVGYLMVCAAFEGATEHLSACLWFFITETAAAVARLPLRAFSLAEPVFSRVFYIINRGRYVARIDVLHRARGKTPYSLLPIFRYGAINPTRQIRLSEIAPLLRWQIPRATLATYLVDDLPPFEAVSFFDPGYFGPK